MSILNLYQPGESATFASAESSKATPSMSITLVNGAENFEAPEKAQTTDSIAGPSSRRAEKGKAVPKPLYAVPGIAHTAR
jgi:hypothetical protein